MPIVISALFSYDIRIANGDADMSPSSTIPTFVEKPVVEPIVIPMPVQTLYTGDELAKLVYTSADKYGANAAAMLATVKCESPQRVVDGIVYYNASGKSMVDPNSWGLAQWNLNAQNRNLQGKVITKEEATTATTSLDIMASYFAHGKARIWSCYRKQLT